MRLLLLNANTTPFVTERAAGEARRVASPGTEIVPVTGDFGGAIIGTRTENAIGEHAAVTLAARHAGSCNAVLIAVSYDTGLRALREMLAVPVVGMTEAALLTACMLGGRIGLISFGLRVQPLYRELVDSYGFSSRIAGWRNLESTDAYKAGDYTALDRAIVEAANNLIAQDTAEVVVLLGAVMAGVPRRVQAQIPVPVLDGIQCGVPQVELLVRLALPKPLTGSYAAPGSRQLSNVDPAIAALLAKGSEKSV
jgi:allantoin racemase